MSDRALTKKEQIRQMASLDPFLRIDEIAAAVETTPGYVRTALSEGRLSLTALRRQLAGKMQRRFAAAGKRGSGRGPASIEGDLGAGRIWFQLIDAGPFVGTLDVKPDASALLAGKVGYVDGEPMYLCEIVTRESVAMDSKRSEGPLRQLLGLDDEHGIRLVDRTLEMVEAPPHVASCLRLAAGDPILKSSALIVHGKERIGIETHYVDARRVRMVLKGDANVSHCFELLSPRFDTEENAFVIR